MPDLDDSKTPDNAPHFRHIRSFVVRAGRMTTGQERAWRELWPRYGVEFDGRLLDLDRVFGHNAPRMLEIGFGTGDALLVFAQQHPEYDCLGIEVHPPGVGHLMLQLRDADVRNVRVMCRDAVEVLSQSLPDRSLDEVHIFFPDPWHKARHHKRRLIQPPFADLLAKVLKAGGKVRLATDWQNYAEQMLNVMNAHPAFANLALIDCASPSGFAARPAHRPLTRFERRGHRLGHGMWDLAYVRK